MVDLASLPDEVRALIEAQAATIARQDAELSAHRVMVEALKLQLARLRRMQFGRSSEKLVSSPEASSPERATEISPLWRAARRGLRASG